MTLPEILRDVHRLLGDIGCGGVEIERCGRQIRFEPQRYAPERYAFAVRDRADAHWQRGDALGACFTIADVLADDWEIS